MKQYGAFEAKTHFSELLGDVINGEKFVITKHGVQVAMLIPFTHKQEGIDPVKDAIRTLKTLRSGTTLGKKLTIRGLMEEGRK
jgi:antitoxin (DNA-binding transcriptional repressor) of toxin-antitoxin stability system